MHKIIKQSPFEKLIQKLKLLMAKKPFRRKTAHKKIQKINPQNSDSVIGAGVSHKGKNYITHTLLKEDKSAIITFYKWQKWALFIIVFGFLASLVVFPLPTAKVFFSIITLLYFFDLLFNFYIIQKSLTKSFELKFEESELENIDDNNLPIYSIMAPLYKEAEVLPQFIEAIKALDWPEAKKDVLIVLEEDDKETISKAYSLNLPENYRVLVVPHSQPKTKPKACNYALALVRGKYVVIYDAEDKPDTNQLKKAYLGFKKSGLKTVCLQSKLNYYNPRQNLLTRLFTAEYSLWFDIILPGLQSINTTIPLGGTSNHFRYSFLKYLDGWDPFNVTEDCDLGTRLFKEGFKTAIIDSTTYEEANSRLKSWFRQRSRWIKGYLQTYLVHMRNPLEFVIKHGRHALIFQLIIGMRMVFILINPIMWATTASYFLFKPYTKEIIESLFPAPIFYIGVFCLVFGNFMYFYNYMIGCAKRGYWDLIKYIFFIPLYWLATGYSAAIAFYQLITKPYYWEKTQHGFHLGLTPKILNLPKFPIIRLEIILTFPGKINLISSALYNLCKSVIIEISDFFLTPIDQTPSDTGKLNILILNWRDIKHSWAGGAETYVHEIAKRWVLEGHQVTLFCGWDGISPREDVIDGIQIIRRGNRFSVYLMAFIYFALKIKNVSFIVDCENGIPFFSSVYTTIPKILLVHHVHQNVFSKHLPFPIDRIAAYFERVVMPTSYKKDPVIAVSESTKEELVNVIGMRSNKIKVINPGVNLEDLGPTIKTPYPSFVYFGRLKSYKNVHLAIEAFSKYLSYFPEAKLYIAGTGEESQNLINQITNNQLTESVYLLGRIKDDQRRQLLGSCWAMIQPSSYEGWGITVLEANACGTSVIAFDVPGLRDSIINSQTGILLSSHSGNITPGVNDAHTPGVENPSVIPTPPVIPDLPRPAKLGEVGIGNPSPSDLITNALVWLTQNPESLKALSINALEWSRSHTWDNTAYEFSQSMYQTLRQKAFSSDKLARQSV